METKKIQPKIVPVAASAVANPAASYSSVQSWYQCAEKDEATRMSPVTTRIMHAAFDPLIFISPHLGEKWLLVQIRIAGQRLLLKRGDLLAEPVEPLLERLEPS